MELLYERAGRLTAENGGFRPGQGCNRTLLRTNQTWGSCGFNNNNMSVYSSATLANDDWRVETMDALPRATRAVGSYWQPNMVRAD